MVFAIALLFGATITYSTSGVNAKSIALDLLEHIVGITDCYTIFSFNVSTAPIPLSGHVQTIVRIVFSDNSSKFAALVTFIDGEFWMYTLNLLSGDLKGIEQSLDNCLTTVNSTIHRYQTYFNASYCSEFARMVSIALQTKNLTIEDDNALLKIRYAENSFPPLEQTQVHCFYKINGKFITPFRSVQLSISKNGLVTRLFDSMRLYRVATTEIKVSTEEAIDLAMPYIHAYAQEHQQKVKDINATLEYVSDITSNRGDRFAIYPQWNVFATFDKTNEEGVFGYSILIWADSGQVYHHDPQGSFQDARSNNVYLFWLLATVIAAVVILPSISAYTLNRAKTRRRNGR